MSFQLQQAAIAAELRRAGMPTDAANRLAQILGNSAQQTRSGPQTQDLTPTALRKITPAVRKYQLQNVDFLEGDPDYRQAQTQPSEAKARPTQASTVRTDASPQQSETQYRVRQGEFTSVRTEGDQVSVGLRVRKTGSFVTQDPTTGSLIGRNLIAQSQSRTAGRPRLSIEEAGNNVIFKLEGGEGEGENVPGTGSTVVPPSEPNPDSPDCTEDSECRTGEICVNGRCVPECPAVPCASDAECGEGCQCQDGTCAEPECSAERRCPDGKLCINGRCVECVTDAQCPAGYECVDGVCTLIPVDPCAGVTCPAGFVCVNGQCYPDFTLTDQYYCCYDSPRPENAADVATWKDTVGFSCQLGPCSAAGISQSDPVQMLRIVKSGPHPTATECAALCQKFDCNAGTHQCDPAVSGQYLTLEECHEACADQAAPCESGVGTFAPLSIGSAEATGDFYSRTVSVPFDQGVFRVDYNAYSIPDRFQVWAATLDPVTLQPIATRIIKADSQYRGEQSDACNNINVSGPGQGFVEWSKPSGICRVEVVVIAPCEGTGWDMSLGFTPNPLP